MTVGFSVLAVVVSLVALTCGGVAAAAPPAVPAAAPTLLLRQLPGGEVLLLDPQGMSLSRWEGGVPEKVATFRPVPCPPHTFAWDESARRLAVLCPFRLEGRLVKDQELYVVEAGGGPRPLRPPPLAFTWALEFLQGELHAAGVPCPPGPCTRWGDDTGRWRQKHLGEPQPVWWRLPELAGRWAPVRAVAAPGLWREFLPAGSKPNSWWEMMVIPAAFEVSPAILAPTASGRRWFFTAAGPHLERLSRALAVEAQFPSPLPPPGRRTPTGARRGRPSEIPVRRLLGATVVGEELYLLVHAEQSEELLRVTPAGEATRQALPRQGGCADRQLLTSWQPWPCAVVVREHTVVVHPPWQEHPLAPEMRPAALVQPGEQVGGDVALGGGRDDEHHQLAGVLGAGGNGHGGVRRSP